MFGFGIKLYRTHTIEMPNAEWLAFAVKPFDAITLSQPLCTVKRVFLVSQNQVLRDSE
jgi:hypothetical protein